MKFVISRTELSGLIRKIQNIVPQNASPPILSHFLVEAKEGELVFTATDLMVGSRCSAAAHVSATGALTLPSRLFFQLVKELTEPQIEISASDQHMAEIRAGSSSFRLHGIGKEQFPLLPDLQKAERFSLSGKILKEMFYRTAFAVAKEESRYALTGVLMRIEKGKALFVGTDGKRLAKNETPIELNQEVSGDYILPIKAVEEFGKILDEEDQVLIYLAEGKLAIESGSTLMVTKLLAGSYPDFEQIVATRIDKRVVLHREELSSLLKPVALFAGASVRFTFTPGELILTANTTNLGEGKVSMPLDYVGEPLTIAFNPIYFLDILRHSKEETVSFGFSDPYNPGIITDGTGSLFVIMPMRIN